MILAPELMEILACPRCKGGIASEGEEPFLVCPACRVKFPIVDGIPVMLIQEAVPLDEADTPRAGTSDDV